MSVNGVGDFYAWQILCDLKESKCIHFDDDMFCKLGPGAKAGLKLIFGDMQGCHALPLAQQLVTAQESAYEELGVEFPYWNGRRLAIKEIEHALCEYCKFRKVTGPRNTSQQAYRSRSHLEENAKCTLCRNKTGDDCYLCDKCNQSFCTKCVPVEPEGIYWSCRLCEELENQYE